MHKKEVGALRFFYLFFASLTIVLAVFCMFLNQINYRALGVGSLISFFSFFSIFALASCLCYSGLVRRLFYFSIFILFKLSLFYIVLKKLPGQGDQFLLQACLPLLSLFPLTIALIFVKKNGSRAIE